MTALGAAVILNAVLLQKARRAVGLKTFDDMTLGHMALVGLAQALSVLPGLSRSGMTTTTLLLLGYRPDEAFKASFVLVPVAGLGATTLAYLSEKTAVVTPEALVALTIGVAVSLVTIKALLEFAKSRHVALVNFVIGGTGHRWRPSKGFRWLAPRCISSPLISRASNGICSHSTGIWLHLVSSSSPKSSELKTAVSTTREP